MNKAFADEYQKDNQFARQLHGGERL